MSDKKDVIKDAVVSVGAWAGTTAGAALITGADARTVAVATAAAGMAALIDKLGSIHDIWTRDRRMKMLVGYAGQDADAATAVADLDEHAHEDWAKPLIFETLRRLNDALDDAVLPAMGRLLRAYISEGQPIDNVYRGLARVLADVSGEEFVSLQKLMAALSDSSVDRDPLDVMVLPEPGENFASIEAQQRDRVGVSKRAPNSDTGDGPVEERYELIPEVGHARRLFHLLILHQLAQDSGLLAFGVDPIAMSKDRAKRIVEIIGRTGA